MQMMNKKKNLQRKEAKILKLDKAISLEVVLTKKEKQTALLKIKLLKVDLRKLK